MAQLQSPTYQCIDHFVLVLKIIYILLVEFSLLFATKDQPGSLFQPGPEPRLVTIAGTEILPKIVT